MSDRREAVVFFPTVGGGEVRLVGITATRLPDFDGTERPSRIVNSVDPGLAAATVADGRYAELPETALQGVFLKFHSKEFSGNSYGLALVLADKVVRLAGDIPRQRIAATGSLIRDGQGAVGAIEGFEEKTRHVLAEAGREGAEPILFLVAADNWNNAAPRLRQSVAEIEETGRLRLLPVAHVSEMERIWDAPAREAEPRPRRSVLRWIFCAAAATAVVAGAAGATYLRSLPLRRCEAALHGLERTRDALAVGTALESCAAARSAHRHDGRAAFLLGQVHFVNGSDLLAERYWREAAAAADPDGMAAMGRLLRTEHRGADADAQAVEWLKRAIEAGRASAKEDLGWMYFEGRGGLAQDQAAGKELWRSAAHP